MPAFSKSAPIVEKGEMPDATMSRNSRSISGLSRTCSLVRRPSASILAPSTCMSKRFRNHASSVKVPPALPSICQASISGEPSPIAG